MTARRQPGSVTASTRLDPWTQGDAAMPMPDEESVTRLLGDAGSGKPDAWNKMTAQLHRDLHQNERAQIRQQRRCEVRSPTSRLRVPWLKVAHVDLRLSLIPISAPQ